MIFLYFCYDSNVWHEKTQHSCVPKSSNVPTHKLTLATPGSFECGRIITTKCSAVINLLHWSKCYYYKLNVESGTEVWNGALIRVRNDNDPSASLHAHSYDQFIAESIANKNNTKKLDCKLNMSSYLKYPKRLVQQ